VNPIDSLPNSAAFVTEFDAGIQNVLFSTYFGGPSGSLHIYSLALDTRGRAHIIGTAGDDLPTTPSAYLGAVTAPAPAGTSPYPFAALIDPTVAGPGICFSGTDTASSPVGITSQGSFTITDCGNAPLDITNLQSTSAVFAVDNATNCIGTLAPDTSCTVVTDFTPKASGAASASITVTSNAPIPTNNIAISGVGSSPQISVLPAILTFAQQVVGVAASGTNQTITITNNGAAALTVSPAQTTVTGDFSIISDTCTLPIAVADPLSPPQPDASCTITIGFAPTALGVRTGTLTIASNDPVTPAFAVPLSGTAIGSYSTPGITALLPPSGALGTTGLTLQVQGTNFFPTSTVVMGGEPLTTTYVSSTLLQAAVDPTLLTSWVRFPSSPGIRPLANRAAPYHLRRSGYYPYWLRAWCTTPPTG
jgi:hypothetical protein